MVWNNLNILNNDSHISSMNRKGLSLENGVLKKEIFVIFLMTMSNDMSKKYFWNAFFFQYIFSIFRFFRRSLLVFFEWKFLKILKFLFKKIQFKKNKKLEEWKKKIHQKRVNCFKWVTKENLHVLHRSIFDKKKSWMTQILQISKRILSENK